MRSAGRRRRMARDPLLEAIRAHGARDVEALQRVAAEGRQLLHDGLGVDPLGDDREAQAVGEVDHGADDRLGRVIGQERLDEGLVDLDRRHGKALQVRQRGVARAEVVEGETNAEADEGLEAA